MRIWCFAIPDTGLDIFGFLDGWSDRTKRLKTSLWKLNGIFAVSNKRNNMFTEKNNEQINQKWKYWLVTTVIQKWLQINQVKIILMMTTFLLLSSSSSPQDPSSSGQSSPVTPVKLCGSRVKTFYRKEQRRRNDLFQIVYIHCIK